MKQGILMDIRSEHWDCDDSDHLHFRNIYSKPYRVFIDGNEVAEVPPGKTIYCYFQDGVIDRFEITY